MGQPCASETLEVFMPLFQDSPQEKAEQIDLCHQCFNVLMS